MLISLLSILGSGLLSFFVLRNNALEQSKTRMQKKTDALMASLDYAVSHTQVKTSDLRLILANEIFEIADINKQDIVLYDLKGNFLISNKEQSLISQKKIPKDILAEVLSKDKKVDRESIDSKTGNTVSSSYIPLKNNMLENIALVYFPYYHDNSIYLEAIYKYAKYIVLVDIFIILFSIWLSWIISKNLTNTLTKFSKKIDRLTLFENDMQPIRYYHNDELGSLAKAYNKMILQIQDQKERLSMIERENAWREMAKQIAHEVKNPLTPMKLAVQNFERKFDPKDPEISEKVKKMSATVVEQIDLIASVASEFSQFARLPEKMNETFDLNLEIDKIIEIFSGDRIYRHTNQEQILINFNKIYLNRIITNLVTNAKQAESPERALIINIDTELANKRITITVEDNGIGIKKSQLERIFEPNFTTKTSGMGLGLSMVKKMVEDYEGEISATSQIDHGTSFVISLSSGL